MIPAQPQNSFRVTLQVASSGTRLDGILMEALRAQDQNAELKAISRANFKKLFASKRIMIKGQNARPASELASGITYVDILGYEAEA